MCAMEYQYFTGKTIDYLAIQSKLEQGDILETYDEYEDFFKWINVNSDKRVAYFTAVIYAGDNNDITLNWDDSYLKYKNVIENCPEQIEDLLNMQTIKYKKYEDSSTQNQSSMA